MFAGTPRHLRAQYPARDTHRSLVVPPESHRYQPAAGLPGRTAARYPRCARSGRDRRAGPRPTARRPMRCAPMQSGSRARCVGSGDGFVWSIPSRDSSSVCFPCDSPGALPKWTRSVRASRPTRPPARDAPSSTCSPGPARAVGVPPPPPRHVESVSQVPTQDGARPAMQCARSCLPRPLPRCVCHDASPPSTRTDGDSERSLCEETRCLRIAEFSWLRMRLGVRIRRRLYREAWRVSPPPRGCP